MTRNQKYYRSRQERIRDEAIEWQYKLFNEEFEDDTFFLQPEMVGYFEKLGKRFGLIREFRENLII